MPPDNDERRPTADRETAKALGGVRTTIANQAVTAAEHALTVGWLRVMADELFVRSDRAPAEARWTLRRLGAHLLDHAHLLEELQEHGQVRWDR